MLPFEDFKHHYEKSDFLRCAQIMHSFIDERLNHDFPFPVAFLSRIEHLVKGLHQNGFPAPNHLEFHKICLQIYEGLLKWPGNPEMNN